MNDNDNRRPRRRAARSAGPPVDETAAGTVTISKSETASTADDTVKFTEATVRSEDATVKLTDATVKSAATVKSGVTTVKPADDTVKLADAVPATTDKSQVDLAKSADDTEAAPRSGARILALAAAIVLVLALVAGAGFAAFTAYSVNRDEDLRAQYTETARQAVLNLTTIRADTAKDDIDRILSVASGDFKTEFDGRVDPFMDIVKQANVVSTGEVVESGIVSADDKSAQVLVAAKQTVSNNGSPEPQSRQYRFRITVSNSDTGMTVSKVEFVG
ncbi:Mce protein [Nocardia sp. NPDC058497]|uniref:Mce protein n=1 Tax=Nocardia sp. NPDC058497 TaxID=3346529 RepID=UPI0036461FF4